ncbi:MAG TPA: molecular chaperone Tir [Candidatus Mailhella merdavium]|nr:molecular chaperone Tir [Candidatus Mailhella merdavium]
MAPLSNLVAALASHAGWKDPRQDEDGAYRFRLENGLDFAVFSPDDRVVVLRADITALPAAAMEREEMLRDAAKRQAGVCRTRASVAAVEYAGQSLLKSDAASGDRLVLYRMAELAAGQETFELAARDFLNDLAWWKASFGGGRSERRTDQPFFGMTGMFGGMY